MKEKQTQAKVVLAKCSKSKGVFGMRIEERQHDWVRTWAFKIDEGKAKREGFDTERTSGTMQPAPEYPGCPYCGEVAMAQCSCGEVFCWSGEGSTATCPWCEKTGEYHTVETLHLQGGGY
jgi:hypothetical protein